ncbi:hypothetical protein [Neobacillus sp. PS3-40]|nr:hypothetical protein [Neobacillus sp. PS3-40]WML44285.1 hypothetical protein RCG20_21365 [Neobacillus sp. PS3-40]
MPNKFIENLKNLQYRNTSKEIDINEFERLESKHTRVRHDEDLRENIRVH